MNKSELRALYRQIRLRMSQAEVASKSRLINRRLINQIAWEIYSSICLFEPIEQLNEVNVKALTSRLTSQDKAVYVLSRAKDAKLPDQKFDLIIVPCLAFDQQYYRLGWGGGFYDRFLATQSQAMKIGVCFSNGFVKNGLPREPHDIPLDRVLSESGDSG